MSAVSFRTADVRAAPGPLMSYVHDIGGPIGMRFATAHPERIAGLIFQSMTTSVEGWNPERLKVPCYSRLMKLPGAERAIVEIGKLRDYCLNPMHPRGRHKARVFASALRIVQADAELLRARLLDAVRQHDSILGDTDDYGQRYIIDFECVKGDQSAVIRSGWIVRRSDDLPRLTTCYVLSKEDA